LSSKNSFVLESGSVIGNIKEKKKTLAIRNDNAVDLEFPSEIVPEFLSGIFTLKSFSLFENSEYVCSEPIRGCGVSWRLKIYPKGNGKATEGYLSVFLEILEGTQNPTRYEYKIQLINQRNPNGPHFMKEFISEHQAKDCWGYGKFFKISLLEEEGFILPEKDQIVFKFSVRVPTYYEKCQKQEKYIQHLEKINKEALERLAELEQKLALEIKEKERLMKLNSNNTQENLCEDLLGLDNHKLDVKYQTKTSEGSYFKSERSTNNEELFDENSVRNIQEENYQRKRTDPSEQNDSKDGDILHGIKETVLRQDSDETQNEVNLEHHFEVVEHDHSFQNLSSSSIEECCDEIKDNPDNLIFDHINEMTNSINNENGTKYSINRSEQRMEAEMNFEQKNDLLLSFEMSQIETQCSNLSQSQKVHF